MASHAAVCIDDNFSASEAAVAYRPANNKLASWVDVEFGFTGNPVLRQHGFNNFFHNRFAKLLLSYVWIVLGRKHNGFNSHWATIVIVAESKLALSIRAQKTKRTATCFRLTLD